MTITQSAFRAPDIDDLETPDLDLTRRGPAPQAPSDDQTLRPAGGGLTGRLSQGPAAASPTPVRGTATAAAPSDGAAAPPSTGELASAARERIDLDALSRVPGHREFLDRLDRRLGSLVGLVGRIYGDRVGAQDLAVVVGDLAAVLSHAWAARPEVLRELDRRFDPARPWWLDRRAVVAAAYADRWAGGFHGVRERIPYLRELGVTHLRLMPPFRAHPQHPDGGFAISSYRAVAEGLGELEDLRALAAELQEHGIALALDVTLSRTAADHQWAQAAAQGSAYFEGFYRVRRVPRRGRSGAAGPASGLAPQSGHRAGHDGWVPMAPSSPIDTRMVRAAEAPAQWDLDWSSPRVMLAMAGELLHVAGLGAQVLRVDAAPRLWSAPDPDRSLERGQLIVDALAVMLEIVAPSAVLESQEHAELSGAGGARVAQALDRTAMIWSSLATRSVEMLSASIHDRGGSPEGAGHLQPVRHHDALTWCFSDEDAAVEQFDPAAHRRFLDSFYTGRFPGSFAAGSHCLPWQGQPGSGVCGTAASLAGAGQDHGAGADRLLLAHAVAFSLGGVPELWLGDELGELNDPHWAQEPGHAEDPRWTHRPRLEPEAIERRHDLFSTSGRVYGSIRRMLQVRAETPEFDGRTVIGFDTRSPAVLGYQRPGRGQDAGAPESVVLCLANFSDWAQYVTGETLSGFLPQAAPLMGGGEIDLRQGLLLDPHGWHWIRVHPR